MYPSVSTEIKIDCCIIFDLKAGPSGLSVFDYLPDFFLL